MHTVINYNIFYLKNQRNLLTVRDVYLLPPTL